MKRSETHNQAATAAEKNAKHTHGRAKIPLRHIPPTALAQLGLVMQGGAAKYGEFNWSEGGVVASVYYDAAMRHLLQWFSGEDFDIESGHPHEAHVMACMAIILDCRAQGNLEDDRPQTASFGGEFDGNG